MPSPIRPIPAEGITDFRMLLPPADLIELYPVSDTSIEAIVLNARKSIQRVLSGADDRLLVVIGPDSIHDPAAALHYARRLAAQRSRYCDSLNIVMRVNLDKPKESTGWTGIINDPYLNESFRINQGLRIARQLLIEINEMGVPTGSKLPEVISPQYLGDLLSWGVIGACTAESQVHRELASGISAPVGFQGVLTGEARVAINAIHAAAQSHHFMSIHKNGRAAVVQTQGNLHCHVVLRAVGEPGCSAGGIETVCKLLEAENLAPRIMVDCVRDRHAQQMEVLRDTAALVSGGSPHVFGVFLESFLQAGAQRYTPGSDQVADLEYGKSITRECLGWEQSLDALELLSQAVKRRRHCVRLSDRSEIETHTDHS